MSLRLLWPVAFISSIEVNSIQKHKNGRAAFTCSSAVIFITLYYSLMEKSKLKNHPRINLIPGTVLLTHFQSNTERPQSTQECTTVPKPTKTTTLIRKLICTLFTGQTSKEGTYHYFVGVGGIFTLN